jgi:hypothetical protein
MRLWPDVFLPVTAGIILALHAQSPLFAQTKGVAANPQGAAVSVPFIGCTSAGQTGMLEAPKGPSRSVPISPENAQALAYYTSADGIGLLAPRGWYCEGVSGSSAYALFLSPKPIGRSMSGWEGLEGSAIEINHMNGGTSGRYDIAQIIGRVFPAYRAFAIRALEGFDLPIPSGPYPKDTLEYRGKAIVEYKTPSQTDGLGNFDSWLGKNDMPIVGAAILLVDPPPNPNGDPPDAVRLSVRLPPDLVRLASAIVSYVERDVVGAARK